MSAEAVYIPVDRFPAMTRAPKSAGEWRFVDDEFMACPPPAHGEVGMLHFACIRHGGNCGYIRVGNGFKPPGEKTWQWNGRTDKPTLTPSINCLAAGPKGEKYAGCGWHAFLTDGQWTGE